jgi:hypothetical protein
LRDIGEIVALGGGLYRWSGAPFEHRQPVHVVPTRPHATGAQRCPQPAPESPHRPPTP